MKKSLSVVIPVYNEASSILEVMDSICKLPVNKEIIIINDGSSDNTSAIIENFITEHPADIKYINKKTNEGKGMALREGFKHVNGDFTVIQDADMEYETGDIVKMLDYAMDHKSDVVYGNRFTKERYYKGMDWKNFIGNNFILPVLASILYGQLIPDEATCYKMFRTDILKSIPLKCKRFEFCPEITAKIRKKNYRIDFVPINYHPRKSGSGKKLNALRDGSQAVWTLIKYRFTD